jgi:leucyl aminopeptidase (aminopeptidase T)
MSDPVVAMAARALVDALGTAAYSRSQEDWKEVLRRQTELCAVVRAEKEEQKEGKP